MGIVLRAAHTCQDSDYRVLIWVSAQSSTGQVECEGEYAFVCIVWRLASALDEEYEVPDTRGDDVAIMIVS